MTSHQRKYEFEVSASVVLVFALLAVTVIACSDPPEFASQYVQFAIAWLLFTTPWAIAVKLLWRAWWARNGTRLSTMDWPARILAAAVATLPEQRRDWGAAMTAELDRPGAVRAGEEKRSLPRLFLFHRGPPAPAILARPSLRRPPFLLG